MNAAEYLGKVGAGLLLDARGTVASNSEKLDRFFAQFADDHLRGAEHRFVTVAPRVYLLLVDPSHSAAAATLGADLARCAEHLGFGSLVHRLYRLPAERKHLAEAIAETRAAPVANGTDAAADPSGRLDTLLSGLDLTHFTHERPVYGLDDKHDVVRFHDLEIDLKAIGEAIGVGIAGNPALVDRASTLVERRILRDLPVSARARNVPICVHFHSRFAESDFFEKAIGDMPALAKNRLVLDFSAGDVVANEGRIGVFFEKLHAAGISISVSQVEWARADALAPFAPRVTWFKGSFAKDAPVAHGLLVLGAARCIAEGLATADDARAAAAAGLRTLSGPGAEAFVAARASAVARGAGEAKGTAPAERK